MADQIEKIVTGFESAGELPIATTEEPGIASFAKEDFLVTAQGKVEALTKWGIAHVLNYRGVNDVARMYNITASFGKQKPKVGDVGLVLSDQVHLSADDSDLQIGQIVLLTAIQTSASTPIIYYGENLGSIAGPRGIQGKIGPMGAIQLICTRTQGAGHMGIDHFLDGSTVQDSQIGKLCLVVEEASNYHCGDVVRITYESRIYNNTREYDGDIIGNIRGPQGTSVKAVYHDPEKDIVVDGNTLSYGWRLVEGIGAKPLITNDIVVVTESTDAPQYMLPQSVHPGTMFVISNTEKDSDGNTYGVSITTPIVKSPQFNLGLFNLSVPVIERDNFIVWKIVESNYGEPFAGAMGFCTNPDSTAYYGKLFTILSASKVPSEGAEDLPEGVNPGDTIVTTSNVGADFRGPVQELTMGSVTAVPNDETGAAGQASASMTSVDRLHNKLNLSIPVGPQGKQGIEGKRGPQGFPGPARVANVNARGAYDPTITYVQNDIVYFNTQYTNEVFGGSYIRTENLQGEAGLTPKDNPTAWGLFVAEGAPGADGGPGPVGPAGENGMNGSNGAFQCIGRVRGISNGEIDIEPSYIADPSFWASYYYVSVLVTEEFEDYDNNFHVYAGSILKGYANAYDEEVGVFLDFNSTEVLKGFQFQDKYVVIKNPVGATQGDLSVEDFNILQENNNNKIIFDNEIYVLNDKGHDAGYNVYTHVGHNSQNNFIIKCITVNTSNMSWVLTQSEIGDAKKYVFENYETELKIGLDLSGETIYFDTSVTSWNSSPGNQYIRSDGGYTIWYDSGPQSFCITKSLGTSEELWNNPLAEFAYFYQTPAEWKMNSYTLPDDFGTITEITTVSSGKGLPGIISVRIEGKKVSVDCEYNYKLIKAVSNTLPKFINITEVPSSATSGTLTEEQVALLNEAPQENYIMFYGEKFIPMDIRDDKGYRVYTHHGETASKVETSKFLYLTLSTRGWVLNISENRLYIHNVFIEATSLAANFFWVRFSIISHNPNLFNRKEMLSAISRSTNNTQGTAAYGVRGSQGSGGYDSIIYSVSSPSPDDDVLIINYHKTNLKIKSGETITSTAEWNFFDSLQYL